MKQDHTQQQTPIESQNGGTVGSKKSHRLIELLRGATKVALFLITVTSLVFGIYAVMRTSVLAWQFIHMGMSHFHQIRMASRVDQVLVQDISTASAWVVMLFAFCLAWTMRHLRWNKSTSSVFPAWLEPASIRLGLMGTLLSFALIAYQLYRPPSEERKPSQAIAGEMLSDDFAGAALTTPGSTREIVQKARETSYEVFLLLCASLYSTLVGCAFGYYIIPIFNRWIHWAYKLTPVSESDFEEVEKNYLNEVKELTHRLGVLKGLTSEVEDMGRKLNACAKPVEEVTQRFVQLQEKMHTTVENAVSFAEAGKALKNSAAEFKGIAQAIQNATNTYQAQISQTSVVLKGVEQKVGIAMSNYGDVLKGFAGVSAAMKDEVIAPVGNLLAFSGNTLQHIRELLEALFALRKVDREFTQEAVTSLRKSRGSFAKIVRKVKLESSRLGALELNQRQTSTAVAQIQNSGNSSHKEMIDAIGGQQQALTRQMEEQRKSIADLKTMLLSLPSGNGSPLPQPPNEHVRGWLRSVFRRD